MDEYYILNPADDERFAELDDPCDSHGELFPDFQRVDPDARGTCCCVDRRTRLADCVYSLCSFYISERAAEVFKRYSAPEGTVYLPVDVFASKGKPVGRMVAVMIPEWVEAVDLEASRFESYPDGMPECFTAPPVLQAVKLQGLDLLDCLFLRGLLCSGKLKREIEKEGLTNFTFEPVVVK